jgi:hypothetical protein
MYSYCEARQLQQTEHYYVSETRQMMSGINLYWVIYLWWNCGWKQDRGVLSSWYNNTILYYGHECDMLTVNTTGIHGLRSYCHYTWSQLNWLIPIDYNADKLIHVNGFWKILMGKILPHGKNFQKHIVCGFKLGLDRLRAPFYRARSRGLGRLRTKSFLDNNSRILWAILIVI